MSWASSGCPGLRVHRDGRGADGFSGQQAALGAVRVTRRHQATGVRGGQADDLAGVVIRRGRVGGVARRRDGCDAVQGVVAAGCAGEKFPNALSGQIK